MKKTFDFRPDMILEIAPNAHDLVLVRKMIESVTREIGLKEKEALPIVMAVDEACSNSIYGIKEKEGEQPSSKVRVEVAVRDHCLRIAIKDTGKNYAEFFEKAIPFHPGTDRTRNRGYGLQIIKTFMDEVHYFHEPEIGNQLILTKYLESASTS